MTNLLFDKSGTRLCAPLFVAMVHPARQPIHLAPPVRGAGAESD
ncbi:hypothetical protein [Bifidobacterium callitrichidarum]|nr:hypothetical protein [Bifidobacterium callitrichidarum]